MASWPWKKKSSDKAGVAKALLSAESPGASARSQGHEESYKKSNYVQLSMETYSHLTGMENRVKTAEDRVKAYEDQVKAYEDQMKSLEDQVEELNDSLSTAQTETANKEELVKQQAKVAEEAVSGWEKAEAEALALKNHLESVTLLKLSAEGRAAHLDSALKECMSQIRDLKEEHQQKLHEVIVNNNKQLDKMKLAFEAKIGDFEQELRRSEAESAALSRSLQERSNMLMKISEEKSRAESEIELLRSNIELREKEINSLKYELHVIAKELEIRNEEKNMSVRSADVANKQHLEGVKKIAKLEAEVQRLRGLVRKKLPGPAAMAQMKLEVESLGRDHGDSRVKRSPGRSSTTSPRSPQQPEFSFDFVQKFQKENEQLTERLYAMEDETNMLKEALAKRNSELQASRNACAQTISKLQNLESQLQTDAHLRGGLSTNGSMNSDGSLSQNASSPSLTSITEAGHNADGSCAGSCSEKENNTGKCVNGENGNHLELMDDFLEMEKLAHCSNEPNGAESRIADQDGSVKESQDTTGPQSEVAPLPLRKLQSRISMLIENMPTNADTEKILGEIKSILQETYGSGDQPAANCAVEGGHSSDVTSVRHACPETTEVTEIVHSITEELSAAISQIHEFVSVLANEAIAVLGAPSNGDCLTAKIQHFSTSFEKAISSRINLLEFVLDLSHIMSKASELRFNILGYKNNEGETISPHCIDKVALPENKVVQESKGELDSNGYTHFSDSTSDPDIPHEGSFIPSVDSNVTSRRCSLDEFEQLKLEKQNMALDLASCSETLKSTKLQLVETEKLLAEVKSQLESAKNSNSLCETQLKCMVESYKSLEVRAEELQTEVHLLRTRTESLEIELQEERCKHLDALAKCKDFQEQLQRNESCTAGEDAANNAQEKDIAAAAEKLAECQETIFLLSKQLKTFRPQSDFTGSPNSERSHKVEGFSEEPITSGMNSPDLYQTEIDYPTSDTEAYMRSPNNNKHQNQQSGSSSASSTPTVTPDKHNRGFSRFFSPKGKNGY